MLTVFDRVNIANCAAKRAQMNVIDEKRYYGEYNTVRAWVSYRCYIRPDCQFVESPGIIHL